MLVWDTQEYPVGPDLLSLHLVLAQPNFTTIMNSPPPQQRQDRPVFALLISMLCYRPLWAVCYGVNLVYCARRVLDPHV